MNRIEFITILTSTLKERKINDVDEIVAEYEQHFKYKLADGYSEEEIAVRLGDPKSLAKQFDMDTNRPAAGNKPIVVVGLILADILVTMVFILVFAWVIVMGATVAAFTVVGVCLCFNLNIFGVLPSLPYSVALVFATMSLALAVLMSVGTIYCWYFARQLFRGYGRWHRNVLASAGGRALLPQIQAYPQIRAVTNRRMRKTALIALVIVIVTSQLGYIMAALSAGALEFWHTWGWFVK
ncbi:MAG: DUF1700 domain-containing protein [Anaerolineae bacterium]